MRTEAEAVTTFCPIIETHCVASGCMAWRWGQRGLRGYVFARDSLGSVIHDSRVNEHDVKRPVLAGPDWVYCPSDDVEPAGWREPQEAVDARRKGYCGLAGRPDDDD